jgi:hypothetical protein
VTIASIAAAQSRGRKGQAVSGPPINHRSAGRSWSLRRAGAPSARGLPRKRRVSRLPAAPSRTVSLHCLEKNVYRMISGRPHGQGSNSVSADKRVQLPRISRAFFLSFALIVAVLVIASFFQSFFVPVALGRFSAPWFVPVHGTLFLFWTALLVAQSVLVARRRTRTHQRLGWVLVGLIPLMVASGVAVALWASVRDFRSGGGDAAVSFFGGQLMDMLMFGAFSSAAFVMRRDPQSHKRLIVLATLAILGAAIGRIPTIGAAANYVTTALLVALSALDLKTLHKLHRVTLFGGFLLLVGIFSQNYLFSLGGWLNAGRRILQSFQYAGLL